MRKSESLEATEIEMEEMAPQNNDDIAITKDLELKSSIKPNLEEGQRTLFDSYEVIE